MYRLPFIVSLILVVPVARADDPLDKFRRSFKPPETVEEYWDYIKFEIELGRYDLAADALDKLLTDKKPTPKELYKLYEKERIAPFLKLRFVKRWYEDREKDRRARQQINKLIDDITAAVKAELEDPARIKQLVKNLTGTPEENAYSRLELAKSGAIVVPYVLEELMLLEEAERGPVLDALCQLGHEIVPPLLAALDSPDDKLCEHILEVLLCRKDLIKLADFGMDPSPYVWPLTATVKLHPHPKGGDGKQAARSSVVRRKAEKVLVKLLGIPSAFDLPLAKEVLTRLADREYRLLRTADARPEVAWRWDGKKPVEDKTVTALKAREYLGLRYARQALDIDPKHQPAQVVLLSLFVDRGYEKQTDEKPVGEVKANIKDLLLTVDPDLLPLVLERALAEERTLVVLATVKALGQLQDVRATRPVGKGEAALVRALSYGDRRVRFAAADSLLRIPGVESTQVATRVIEVLIEAGTLEMVGQNRPRVLVALTDDNLRRDVGETVKRVNADALLVSTGRAAMRRLTDSPDVDLLLMDSTLPDPGLHSLLGQLRSDRNLRRLPIFLAAVPESASSQGVLENLRDVRRRLISLEEEIKAILEPQYREYNRLRAIKEERARENPSPQNLNDLRDYILRTEKELVLNEPIQVREKRQEKARLEQRLLLLAEKYEGETIRREEELRRFVEKYPNVWVVPSTQLTDPRTLLANLEDRMRDAGMKALSDKERTENAQAALIWLARMAVGEVKGYDITPAAELALGVLRNPQRSNEDVLYALRIAGRFGGTLKGAVQKELIVAMFNGKLPEPTRLIAARELQRHIQEFGPPDPKQGELLKEGVTAAVKDTKLSPEMREQMTRLVGTLRPDSRGTGQKLGDFMP